MDGLTFMRDVADGILIESKEVEAERGVIVSEKNARDSEQYRVRKRLREYLYKDTEFQMVRKDRPYLQWHGNFVSMVKSISLEEINAEITQAFGTQNKAILTGITVKKEQ